MCDVGYHNSSLDLQCYRKCHCSNMMMISLFSTGACGRCDSISITLYPGTVFIEHLHAFVVKAELMWEVDMQECQLLES